jgi:hydroxylamine reductase
VAALHDLLMRALKGLALFAVEGSKVGVNGHEANVFTCEAMFSTLTNVSFDGSRTVSQIKRVVELRDGL